MPFGKSKIFWALVFAATFILALDPFGRHLDQTLAFGLPQAVIYYVALQLLLFIELLAFSRLYWRQA
ncbi:MAG: hypothetical protein HY519_04710 [Candidatus Aenigmarchaeota archaeon]|nr:hypothetical protein [Candidatus Aenigmarchaeota archaeon]